MGEHSHISVEFDNIVSAVLENYEVPKKNSASPDHEEQGPENRWVQEITNEDQISPLQDVKRRNRSWSEIVNDKGEDMLFLMDDSEKNTHVLLSMLIKHLDHKTVLKEPKMQLDIVEVTTSLTQYAKVQPSVSIIGAISDMIRHLRKSIHCCLDNSNLATDVINWNKNFRKVVDKCLVQLSNKVGEADPVIDVMAVMLENISTITTTSRTTVHAVYRTAQIAFPEALFHQLLVAMVHPDHETRAVAHHIFSVILVPTSVFPRPCLSVSDPKALDVPRTLSRAVTVFYSSASLFEKLKLEKRSSSERLSKYNKEHIAEENQPANSNVGVLNRFKSTHSRVSSVNCPPLLTEVDEITANNDNQNLKAVALRLSKHQIKRLLSSIWAQSISPENMPVNYEAISHTYNLVLLVARTKNSFHEILVRSFQLAFSLWNVSLKEGSLPPSRRRSLFTLAISMIMFSSKAYNIIPLVHSTKEVLTEKKVEPFLRLIEDHKLQAVSFAPDNLTINYGSKEDDDRALSTLSELLTSAHQMQECFASDIISSLEMFSKAELSSVREKLLEEFSPDDTCEFRSQLIMNMPKKDASGVSIDDDFIPELLESQIKHCPSLSMEAPSLLSANQLLELVLDTSHPSGRISVSSAFNMPYKDMADNCEVDSSLADTNTAMDLYRTTSGPMPMLCGTEYQNNPHLFKLPAASPFDNFLKAAGC
ncbi:hypothetical protein SESBI_08019 [Sesbania bispinosa]|nr:hypothetical protein SESBI_08019 [Sesbania bispinosa]